MRSCSVLHYNDYCMTVFWHELFHWILAIKSLSSLKYFMLASAKCYSKEYAIHNKSCSRKCLPSHNTDLNFTEKSIGKFPLARICNSLNQNNATLSEEASPDKQTSPTLTCVAPAPCYLPSCLLERRWIGSTLSEQLAILMVAIW